MLVKKLEEELSEKNRLLVTAKQVFIYHNSFILTVSEKWVFVTKIEVK